MKEREIRMSLFSEFGFDKKLLKKVVKVAKKMAEECDEYWDEVDAEYEAGRSSRPPGYMKRRSKIGAKL